jgi:fluoroacetyl-CoA thioesterase
MEWAVRDRILDVLNQQPGGHGRWDSVGVHVTFSHTAATVVGETVTLHTSIARVDDTKGMITVHAETTISDAVGVLGLGSHTRAVVDMDRINKRIFERKQALAKTSKSI